MKRGEVWTVAGGSHFTGKPRPAIIVQSNEFDTTPSTTVCPCTTDAADVIEARIRIEPSSGNGLTATSYAMADKISTVLNGKLGRRIGRLNDADMLRLDRAMIVFLGLADRR